MAKEGLTPSQREALEAQFSRKLKEQLPLGRYTSSRIGGPADYLIAVRSRDDLVDAVRFLWREEIRFRVVGGGTNILVADAGVRGVVLLNQARRFTFEKEAEGSWLLWAESGASMGTIARRSVERNLTGLEWAAAIPGSVGGAVVNNAGAMGGNTAGSLEVAEILQPNKDYEVWKPAQFSYAYRSSVLKSNPGMAVVLRAAYRLQEADSDAVQQKLAEAVEHRQRTQPAGASWGSTFKNPPGDFAGRLIEAAGLKGFKVGGVEVSTLHANFFLSQEGATASDAAQLIRVVQEKVKQHSGVDLELEVEIFGDWPQDPENDSAEDR
ncbi:MAG: UDP-N-acetylmuramate dehydrogenase [Anaerolineales bacterium]|nr:UDP-N-acetylmuramate dehydrogenase [Anaerolineales bacterium]